MPPKCSKLLEDVDFVFVPIGGGSGAAGCGVVRDGLGRTTRIVGVQARQADAFAQSWRGPARVTHERADTFAEGIATRTTFDLTFSMLKTALDDVVTLEEDEIRDGVTAAIQYTHNLAEGPVRRRWRQRVDSVRPELPQLCASCPVATPI